MKENGTKTATQAESSQEPNNARPNQDFSEQGPPSSEPVILLQDARTDYLASAWPERWPPDLDTLSDPPRRMSSLGIAS